MSKLAIIIINLILILSCSRYPTIPNLEEVEKLDRASEPASAPHKGPYISKIFQEKAAKLIPAMNSHADKAYIIGPEDIINITVWDNDDLSRKVQISQKGDFSYPLIGTVNAEGLSVSGLEEEIKGRLAGRFLINPQVSVSVEEYKSHKVFVLGEVGGKGGGPGTYPLYGTTNLLEVLSRAGGPTDSAGGDIIVVRPGNHNHQANPITPEEAREDETINLSLWRLLEGDLSQNISLRTGDTVFIPKARYFFVFGQVKNPGKFILEEGTTVLKAITIAGGVTERAAVNDTNIVREKNGQRLQIKATMGNLVEAQDIIMVPESFF